MSTEAKGKYRDRLRRYERKLAEEKERFGHYGDGYGKRYMVGPLYLLLDDLDGAIRSFLWFENEFPDDIGDPGQYLCWALALHRASRREEAAVKLRRTVFMNLFVLPHLLGVPAPDTEGAWLGCNLQWPDYIEYIPSEYFELWSADEIEWARHVYQAPGFSAAIARWIEICTEVNGLPPGPKRTALLRQADALEERAAIL